MQLVSLSISGFKSFAVDVKLQFAEGVTSVVGPNGCGKSNVVDALRWVLGEQRSSVLRGERMENVIFNGTNHRKPLNLADVRVVVDNNSGRINLPYSEIEIARRLHRDGTSEYMINGNACRLRDITDMLRDSGMGPNMYSILELKMIESILRDDGDGRRSLFEEASGISQYKLRRRQAMNKLGQTQEDLLRLADIIHEVERQVASLKRQVSKARRYKANAENLRVLESALMYREYVRLTSELKPLERTMTETTDSTEALKSTLRAEDAKLEESRRVLVDAEQETDEYRKQLEVIVSTISTLEAEAAGHRATLDAARETVERTDRQRILGNEKRERYEERREEESRHREGVTGELDDAKRVLEQVTRSYEGAQAKLQHDEQEAEAHHKRVQVIRGQLAELEKSRTDDFARRASFNGQRESAEDAIAGIASERESLADEIAATALQNKKARAAEEKARSAVDARRKEIESLLSRKDERIEQARLLATAEHAAESKLELLATLQEKGPRSSAPIKILRESKVEGMIGLLGDLVNVDLKYRKALQSALGPAAYFYLSETLDSALQAIEVLRKSDSGQTTIIASNAFQDRGAAGFTLPEGAIARASDLIQDSDHPALLEHFLGRVVLVADWDSARKLSPWARENNCTVVTLDGEWINSHGMLHGGSTESRTPVDLGLKQQIGELEETLRATRKEAAATKSQLNAIKDSISDAQSLLADADRGYAQATDRLRVLRDQEVKLNTLQASLKSRESDAESRILECDAEIAKINKDIAALEEGLDKRKAELSKQAGTGEALRRNVATARDTLTLRREELHARERGRDSIQHRMMLVDAELERIELGLKDLADTLRGNEQAAEKSANDIVRIDARLTDIQEELADKFKLRDSRVQEVDSASVRLDQIRRTITEQELAMRRLRSGREDALEGERKISVEVARLQGELDALLTNAKNQHDLNPADPHFAEEHPELLDVETDPETVQELKQKIENLGPVNLLAVDEFEQENSRLEEMLKNREDLLRAKRTLEETIRKINETAEAKFLHTFEAVRENFQKLFVEFFPAGEADLILSGKDLLEADITMWANPSGKRLKSLSLMSGGEKTMTAIALLFSLYRVKPSPFCVLDEVDAPLDDANIDRFTRMLHHHSDETQFILITHNKRTMEIADNLYGVTMQEEGVSKLVSVRLLSETVPETA